MNKKLSFLKYWFIILGCSSALTIPLYAIAAGVPKITYLNPNRPKIHRKHMGSKDQRQIKSEMDRKSQEIRNNRIEEEAGGGLRRKIAEMKANREKIEPKNLAHAAGGGPPPPPPPPHAFKDKAPAAADGAAAMMASINAMQEKIDRGDKKAPKEIKLSVKAQLSQKMIALERADLDAKATITANEMKRRSGLLYQRLLKKADQVLIVESLISNLELEKYKESLKNQETEIIEKIQTHKRRAEEIKVIKQKDVEEVIAMSVANLDLQLAQTIAFESTLKNGAALNEVRNTIKNERDNKRDIDRNIIDVEKDLLIVKAKLAAAGVQTNKKQVDQYKDEAEKIKERLVDLNDDTRVRSGKIATYTKNKNDLLRDEKNTADAALVTRITKQDAALTLLEKQDNSILISRFGDEEGTWSPMDLQQMITIRMNITRSTVAKMNVVNKKASTESISTLEAIRVTQQRREVIKANMANTQDRITQNAKTNSYYTTSEGKRLIKLKKLIENLPNASGSGPNAAADHKEKMGILNEIASLVIPHARVKDPAKLMYIENTIYDNIMQVTDYVEYMINVPLNENQQILMGLRKQYKLLSTLENISADTWDINIISPTPVIHEKKVHAKIIPVENKPVVNLAKKTAGVKINFAKKATGAATTLPLGMFAELLAFKNKKVMAATSPQATVSPPTEIEKIERELLNRKIAIGKESEGSSSIALSKEATQESSALYAKLLKKASGVILPPQSISMAPLDNYLMTLQEQERDAQNLVGAQDVIVQALKGQKELKIIEVKKAALDRLNDAYLQLQNFTDTHPEAAAIKNLKNEIAPLKESAASLKKIHDPLSDRSEAYLKKKGRLDLKKGLYRKLDLSSDLSEDEKKVNIELAGVIADSLKIQTELNTRIIALQALKEKSTADWENAYKGIEKKYGVLNQENDRMEMAKIGDTRIVGRFGASKQEENDIKFRDLNRTFLSKDLLDDIEDKVNVVSSELYKAEVALHSSQKDHSKITASIQEVNNKKTNNEIINKYNVTIEGQNYLKIKTLIEQLPSPTGTPEQIKNIIETRNSSLADLKNYLLSLANGKTTEALKDAMLTSFVYSRELIEDLINTPTEQDQQDLVAEMLILENRLTALSIQAQNEIEAIEVHDTTDPKIAELKEKLALIAKSLKDVTKINQCAASASDGQEINPEQLFADFANNDEPPQSPKAPDKAEDKPEPQEVAPTSSFPSESQEVALTSSFPPDSSNNYSSSNDESNNNSTVADSEMSSDLANLAASEARAEAEAVIEVERLINFNKEKQDVIAQENFVEDKKEIFTELVEQDVSIKVAAVTVKGIIAVQNEGAVYSAITSALSNLASIASRIMSFDSIPSSNDAAIGMAAGDEDEVSKKGMWISGSYANHKKGAKNSFPSSVGRSNSQIFGFDAELNDYLLGLAYSNTHSSFKSKDRTKTSTSGHHIAIYGQKIIGQNFSLKGIILASRNFSNTGYSSMGDIYSNKSKNTSFNYEASLSYNHNISKKWFIAPTIGIRYGHYSGGIQNGDIGEYHMSVITKNRKLLTGIVGSKIALVPHQIFESLSVSPSLHGSVEHNFNGTKNKASLKLTGEHSMEREINLENPPATSYNAGVGVLARKSNVEIMIEYNCHFHNKYLSHQGFARFKVMF